MEASLVNLPVSEISNKLAEKAAAARKLRKQALDLSNISAMLGNLGSSISNHAQSAYNNPAVQSVLSSPELKGGLIGAGVGAVGGGLSSLTAPPERRKTVSNMLTGALAGGAIGAGGTAAYRYFPQAFNAKATIPSGIKFKGPNGVQEVPADLLDREPDAAHIAELPTAETLGQKTVGSVRGGISDYKSNHPFLTGAAGADIAGSSIGAGAEFRNPGGSMNPAQFRRGVGNMLQSKGTGDQFKKIMDELQGNPNITNDAVQMALANARQTGKFSLPGSKGPVELNRDQLKQVFDASNSSIIPGVGATRRGTGSAVMDALGLSKNRPLAGTGYRESPVAIENVVKELQGAPADWAQQLPDNVIPSTKNLAAMPIHELQQAATEAAAGGKHEIASQLQKIIAAKSQIEPTPGFLGAATRKVESFGDGRRMPKTVGRAALYAGIPAAMNYLLPQTSPESTALDQMLKPQGPPVPSLPNQPVTPAELGAMPNHWQN